MCLLFSGFHVIRDPTTTTSSGHKMVGVHVG